MFRADEVASCCGSAIVDRPPVDQRLLCILTYYESTST